jgi:hypothetical protein
LSGWRLGSCSACVRVACRGGRLPGRKREEREGKRRRERLKGKIALAVEKIPYMTLLENIIPYMTL